MSHPNRQMSHPSRVSGRDRIRHALVSLSVVLMILGALIGSGTLGGDSMPEAAGGAFSAESTLIAAGGPAFSIWSVIYAGLVIYAIWQWLPKQAAADRHRSIGYWVAASAVLNAAWLLAVQAGVLWLTVVIMVALLATLIFAFMLLQRRWPANTVDSIITDGSIGLYLGWIIVATPANIAAVLAATGFTIEAMDAWAVGILSVAGLITVALAIRDRGRIAPSLAVAWGLAWVGIERLSGELLSTPAAITAFVAAGVVVVVTVLIRLRTERRVEKWL